ncbi:hypothetical protein L210DRAFT_2303232 [Boletus edulis BED1]|uniref:Uncharacterized protein n=1 Tax=Boletus edulis BED1 TaxID=1328754 RepID=A0AAD4BSA1_BOLED|nr:hypothetical protein L210DRAFT_2303232 [Boletus edulis BED1]
MTCGACQSIHSVTVTHAEESFGELSTGNRSLIESQSKDQAVGTLVIFLAEVVMLPLPGDRSTISLGHALSPFFNPCGSLSRCTELSTSSARMLSKYLDSLNASTC